MSTLPWETGDPLAGALFQLRMKGAFYSWTEGYGDGAIEMPTFPGTLSFHIVSRGAVVLDADGEPDVELRAGDLALVPRGIGHRVATRVGAPLLGRADELPQTMLGEAFSIMRIGEPPYDGAEPPLALLCGILAFDAPIVQDMLDALPPVLVVQSARHPVLAALLPLLAGELRTPRPGVDAVATRLADVLVVESVRAWLADEPDAGSGWLAAMRDPQLGRALTAIHRAPGAPWTLGGLAALATMSRSTFAARFTAVAGTPPMTYVARARMRAAHAQLAGGTSVGAVAAEYGYGSDAAFSRAFARIVGTTPGAVRRSGVIAS